MKLEKLKRLRDEWEHGEVVEHAWSDIKTDDRLQPRVDRIENYQNRGREERKSARQVDDLAAALSSSKSYHLTPILVAEIEGRLYIVDGHHRWKAYRRLGRDILCRVRQTNWRVAARVAGIVNCDARAREMTPSQRGEQCWQFLMSLTENGTREMPPGYSGRALAAAFGIRSHDTPNAMKRRITEAVTGGKRLPTLRDVTEYDVDKVTGAVRWKYARSNKWMGEWGDLDQDQIAAAKDDRWLAKMGNLWESAGDVATALRRFRLFTEQVNDEIKGELSDRLDAQQLKVNPLVTLSRSFRN